MKIAPLVRLSAVGESRERSAGGGLGLIHLEQWPGKAFGDGTHPTTRLCAGAVDFLCRSLRPVSVLDVGTGTGVLARIARARGARFVAGTDIDPDALLAARANAALDLDHEAGPALEAIEFLDASPDYWGERFDLVVANILERPIRELAPALTRAILPGGRLLLSGFTRIQVPMMQAVFQGLDLITTSEAALEDWALLELTR